MKNGTDAPAYVDSWFKFNQLIKGQFPDLVEDDLVRVRRSMTISEPSFEASRMQDLDSEVKSELEQLDAARIIKPGEDIIKNEFKTLEKESRSEVVGIFEKALRNSSGNAPTEKTDDFLRE